jgi:hypothetical protein
MRETTMTQTTTEAPVFDDALTAAIMALPDGGLSSDEAPAEVAPETPEEPAAEPETDDEPKDTPVVAKPDDEAKAKESSLFTDEALATPEGLRTAREHIQRERLTVSKRMSKLRERVHRFGAEKEEFAKDRETVLQLREEQRQVAQSLFGGDAKTIAATIGRLTGKDPVTVVRELSHLLATDGKSNGKESTESAAMKKRLADLEAAYEQSVQEKKAAELTAREQAAVDRIYAVATSAEKYPTIARFVSGGGGRDTRIREALKHIKIEHYNETHQVLSDEDAAQAVERELLDIIGPAVTNGAPAAKSDPGPAPTKPKSGKTLTSKDSAAPAQRRPKTEEERVADLANDPDFTRAIGL